MGLRKVYTNQSLGEVIWHYLVYLEARLLSEEHAKELTGRVTALIDELELVWRGQRASWRSEIAAQAGVDAANYRLDQQTSRFSRVLLSQEDVDLNTGHPRYRRYFPVALSRVTKLPLGPQLKVMRPWLGSIASVPEGALQAFAETLGGLIASGEEALLRQEAAASVRKDHRVRDLNRLVQKINDICQEVFGALKAKAPSAGLSSDWAEGFFYSPRNAAAPDAVTLYQEALYNVSKARGLDISEEASELLDKTKDEAKLKGWLTKLLSAASVEEALGLPAPKEEE